MIISDWQKWLFRNPNNSTKTALKSLGMKSGKVNQSKIALENNGAIQFGLTKNANIFKNLYSDLA